MSEKGSTSSSPLSNPWKSPLSLDVEEMRALGYQVIDMLVDHFGSLPARRVSNISSREELARTLWEPIPEQGMAASGVIDRVRHDVLEHISHVDHPRFFAFIPSPSNFIGVLADALVSGFNVFAGTWIESSGPAVIELVTLDWLRQLCSLPATAGGLFTSGGSVANLTALAVARQVQLQGQMQEAVLYMSDQTHSSIDRALKILGFGKDQVRRLASDATFRLDPDLVRQTVAEDRRAGRVPFCVVANAGATNTGVVDPLVALAGLCRQEGLWLHVDGAYGAAAVITEEGRKALSGIEQADSITLDPHKWFFQPYEIGCVLVRERSWLKDTFHILPEYLKDTERPGAKEINFADYGIQLTRSFRALKLWLSLKVFGLSAFRVAVEHGLQLARTAEGFVHDLPDWQVVTPAQMGIVTFRYAPDGVPDARCNTLNRLLLDRMQEDGYAMLSATTLRGQLVIRLCPINPQATVDDIHETLERLNRFAASVAD